MGNSLHVVCLLLLGTSCNLALAGRPLIVDDANVNGAGHGQLETWIAHRPGSTAYHLAPAYAPVDGLEIGALLARERSTSVTASALQAKWQITRSRDQGCNFATVIGLAHLEAAGNTTYLNGLVTCNRSSLGSVHLNLGVSKARQSSKALGWGVALEREFIGVTPHVEWFGGEHVKPTFQAGVRKNLTKHLQLDGSAGRSAGLTLYTLGAKLSF